MTEIQTREELIQRLHALERSAAEHQQEKVALRERMKELACLHGLSRLFDTPGSSLEEILQQSMLLLPPGWQYPEITAAKLVLDDRVYKTPNHRMTEWRLSSDVRVFGKTSGFLEIVYLEERAPEDCGPFLKEEKDLIDSIAERMGRIAEKFIALENLRRSDIKYRDLYDNAPDMYISVDATTAVILECNQTLLHDLGYEKKDIIGRPVFELYAPDSAVHARERLFPDFLRNGVIKDETLQVQRKDGGLVDVSLNVSAAYDESGRILYSRSVWRDITKQKQVERMLQKAHASLEQRIRERTAELETINKRLARELEARTLAEKALQESERQFRLLAENATDMISKHTETGDYLFVSPSCRGILGYAPEELIGRNAYEFFHPEDLAAIGKSHQAVLENASGCTVAYRIRQKDGHYCWVETTSRTIANGRQGATREIMAITRDISARKEEETELRRVEAALRISEAGLHALSFQLIQAQETERRRISIELHDELGQALMVLKLQLRASQKKIDQGQPELKSAIEESLRYIDGITDRIRRMSRELCPALLDDLGLTAAVSQLAEEAVKHTNTLIKTELEDTRGLLDQNTEISLYRIFQEALTNALKHADASRISLEMNIRDGMVVCRVADNGRGFAAEKRAEGESAGNGMGLTAMAERIRMLGGRFAIQSRPKEGTRIDFSVPRKQKQSS
ncbi:MAG: PAS domain-containing sensor histidine kinase [Thermodesulfobacteriota bacterium]